MLPKQEFRSFQLGVFPLVENLRQGQKVHINRRIRLLTITTYLVMNMKK